MKILAYTSPARGHLYPLVPILDELAARGHEIAVRTLSRSVDEMARRGFDASPVAPAVEAIEHDDYRGRTPTARIARAMNVFGARSLEEVADMRAAIAEHGPDALLVDCNAWGATAIAEQSGRPWAQWFPYPIPLPGPGVPPYGPGFKPSNRPLGRLRDALLWPILLRSFERAALPPLNATRRAVGVQPFASARELFMSPPLILYMTAEPFDYARPWPPSVRMVGPCAWDPPAEPPAWLDEVTQPLVLVSTSSEFQDDGRLVRVALEALADEDVFVAATLPSAGLPDSVPGNARVERFVPHAALLERAACAITHGGAGATQKALAAGVPVCVVPFGRDQLEVARRVEVAGAGTRLPARRLRADRLRAAVRQAMTKRDGARRVAAGYEATGGARTAVDAFEELADSASAGSRTPRRAASAPAWRGRTS
jgi:UDP:flavonoid glycosyltransferase YjiC (YdhE family)